VENEKDVVRSGAEIDPVDRLDSNRLGRLWRSDC
jgi:hypothetical protein